MLPKIVDGELVRLDYGTFQNTNFSNCKLVYEGGRPPTMVGCNFDQCEWIFEGKALHTLQLLAALAQGGGGGAELVVKGFLGLKDWKNG